MSDVLPEKPILNRTICEDCAITFHLMLKGYPMNLNGPKGIIEDIQSELAKLQSVSKVTPEMVADLERRKDPDTWRALREQMKPFILEYWDSMGRTQGYMQNKDLLQFLIRTIELKHYSPPTVERAIRYLADPSIEDPPFLYRLTGDFPSGRYTLSVAYMTKEK